MEQSITSDKSNIVDVSCSSAAANTLSVGRKVTRSQARHMASAGTSSNSKTTRARQVFAKTSAEKENVKSCTPSRGKANFINKDDSTSSSKRGAKGNKNTNITPSKDGRNVIDLSAISVAGGSTRLAGPGSISKAAHETTPYKRQVTAASSTSSIPGTPSSTAQSNQRRAELERVRQEKLLLSEDKRKKAEEKKRDMLDARAQRLKEERDARMEKIRENKLAKEKERQEAANKKPVVVVNESGSAAAVTPAKFTGRTNVRRRAALEAAAITSAQFSATRPKTRAAAAKSATPSLKKGNTNAAVAAASKKVNDGSALKSGPRGKKMTASAAGKSSKITKKARQNDDDDGRAAVAMEVDDDAHQPQYPSADLSPIAKVTGACQPEGINTRLDETFTKDEGAGQKAGITSADTVNQDFASKYNSTQNATLLPNSTFVSEIANQGKVPPPGSGFFAMPAIPEVKKTPKLTPKQESTEGGKSKGTYGNMAKKILLTPKGQKVGDVYQYQMTPPPPPPPTVDNYDISRYIDSDDEEAQAEKEATTTGKPLPSWVIGRPFLEKLRRQFGQTDEQLAVQAARIFPLPLFPVPLELMGLPVKERYVTRSSSVNWNTAKNISPP